MILSALALAATSVPALQQTPFAEATSPAPLTSPAVVADDLVDTLANDGRFSTLVTAVQVAGLEDALRARTRTTIFAPTDAAFAAVPADVLAELLANPDVLAQVLLYHAYGDALLSPSVVAWPYFTSLQGQRVDIDIQGTDVFTDQAQIEQVDLLASNGVIHVIDAVMLPALDDARATVSAVADLSTLDVAIETSGLTLFEGDGPFTIFAPVDSAFAALPAGVLDRLLLPQNRTVLRSILRFHVVQGAGVYADQLSDGQSFTTMQGGTIDISIQGGEVFAGGIRVIAPDVEVSNGVVHLIEGVLLP